MPDLADGESIQMQGSGREPYVIKNLGGVYSCTCPAWRNQSVAIDVRTCKHIRKLRGDKAEQDRIGQGSQQTLPAAKRHQIRTRLLPVCCWPILGTTSRT